MRTLWRVAFVLAPCVAFSALVLFEGDRVAPELSRSPPTEGVPVALERSLPEALLDDPARSSITSVEQPSQPLDVPVTELRLGDNLVAIQTEYDALVIEIQSLKHSISAELTSHGLYRVSYPDESGESPPMSLIPGVIQVFRGVSVGDGYEFRQFDILEREYPDLYALDRHRVVLEGILHDSATALK